MDKLIWFFTSNIPPVKTIAIGAPIFLLWAYLCLRFAGYLKVNKGIKTGYSRKTFHLLIFISATVLQLTYGLPVVCLFGAMASLIIAYAIFRGQGHPLYESMAREQDSPYGTYYIVVPYFATLIGGIVSNILFSHIAIMGYLVGGLGDAAGEPIGTRFGKHKYTVPSLSKIKTTRSLEGSLGVFLVSLLAIIISVMLLPNIQVDSEMLIKITTIALASSLVEAISPHGWDNTTMQIVPSYLAFLFF